MSPRTSHRALTATAISLLALLVTSSAAAEAEIDLSAFDLEDLMSMQVTSVSKKSERAFEAPAAAFVITSEDIRRSGARSIPELLRMVPGVQVAQLSSSQYAISVRGFSGNFSDKLLVMIDGRSIYTPLFAGVFWDVQDTPLADIDRIEVIRGPGGTIWGANAVNGVINIVTKSAAKTKGWHVDSGVGDYERGGSGVLRYGGGFGDNVDFRVYLRQFDREKFKNADGLDADDAWDQIRTGFRMDARVGDSGELTLQGDLYDGHVNSTVAGAPSPSTVGGGNVLTRYTHNFSDTHNASLQFYYDRTDRNANILNYELDTIDLELKHQIAPVPWLDFVWGGEYRYRSDDAKTANPDTADFDDLNALLAASDMFFATSFGQLDALVIEPDSRKWNLFSGFVQAEARAFEDMLRFTIGTKAEKNDTSGFEIQPSARIAFVPNATMTFWGSASRAVRTPSRANDDIDTFIINQNVDDDGQMVIVRNHGSRNIESEDLMAYEMGIRVQPVDWLHFDLSGFYNDYDDLIVQDVDEVTGPIPVIPPLGSSLFVVDRTASNEASGVAWGIEFFGRVHILENRDILEKWWIDATYSYVDVDLDRNGGRHLGNVMGGALGPDDSKIDGTTESHHTLGLRSHMNFVCDLELDLAYYYASKVSEVGGMSVDDYHRFDLRTAWHPTEHVEVSFTVENVFDGSHQEWNTELFIAGTKIPRTFYGKLALDF